MGAGGLKSFGWGGECPTEEALADHTGADEQARKSMRQQTMQEASRAANANPASEILEVADIFPGL